MVQHLIQESLSLFACVGADPHDTDEVRLQKTLSTLGAFMFIAAGILWAILYFSFGEYIAGSIPLGYAIISSLSVIIFHRTHLYRPFLFTQLAEHPSKRDCRDPQK